MAGSKPVLPLPQGEVTTFQYFLSENQYSSNPVILPLSYYATMITPCFERAGGERSGEHRFLQRIPGANSLYPNIRHLAAAR